jgi:hypothetical protein
LIATSARRNVILRSGLVNREGNGALRASRLTGGVRSLDAGAAVGVGGDCDTAQCARHRCAYDHNRFQPAQTGKSRHGLAPKKDGR